MDVRSDWRGAVGPVAFRQDATPGAVQTKVTAWLTFTAPTRGVTPGALPASWTSGLRRVNGPGAGAAAARMSAATPTEADHPGHGSGTPSRTPA